MTLRREARLYPYLMLGIDRLPIFLFEKAKVINKRRQAVPILKHT
jgi:hypothetical protein